MLVGRHKQCCPADRGFRLENAILVGQQVPCIINCLHLMGFFSENSDRSDLDNNIEISEKQKAEAHHSRPKNTFELKFFKGFFDHLPLFYGAAGERGWHQ